MFANLDKNFNHADLEAKILALWTEEDLFNKVLENSKDNPNYIFYEGPPTANGSPGIHHIMARSVKDSVCRYKTMRGFHVSRKAGWDTHGLPVEIEVQKKLKIDGRREVIDYGIEAFNKACRKSVFSYKDQWDQMTQKMGYWIDLKDPYITCDNNYIESVWWILKQFHDKGLIYKGHRIVAYSPGAQTPLSSHEVDQGYKEVKDPSIYVIFKTISAEFDLLVWTTTPWTLYANVAVCVHKDVDYAVVKVEDQERPLVIAADLVQSALNTENFTILRKLKGAELLGIQYEPLFKNIPVDKKAYYVVEDNFVSTSDGTGLVHIAPAFGEDDYKLKGRFDLPMPCHIDSRGCFDDRVPEYSGTFVKDADVDIITALKKRGQIVRSQKITHRYPFCWRTDVPLIYMAMDSWYIRMTDLKDQLIEANKKINWFPANIGEGRFGKWLDNLQDWSLSRDRFWGTPLPVWCCENKDCGHTHAIGSKAELIELCGAPEDIDLHKPYVDELVFACEKCGGTMKRTPEVIDCWFDSGAMPFAQQHYPFENKDNFTDNFPADFICEGIDQTRGWFYSLLAISVFLKGESPYRNVVVNELILDKNGNKMSKRLGNGIDPFALLDEYGADLLRWYLLSCTSVWLPTRFDVEGILDCKRKLFDTLVNTYRFFVMYANVDDFNHESPRIPIEERPMIDLWMVSRMNTVAKEVLDEMDSYDLTKATNLLTYFFTEEVSNWYVRLNRRRFWKDGDPADKFAAYCTLQEIMIATACLMAPMAPFISDFLFRSLTGQGSVHEAEMPQPDAELAKPELEEKMELTRKVVEIGRNLRTRHNLKVRQPLPEIIVKSPGEVFTELVLQELNVKSYSIVSDDSGLVSKKTKANFKKLGPLFGKRVPQVAALLNNLNPEQMALVEAGKNIFITLENEEIEVNADCIEILVDHIEGLVAEGDGSLMVALKTELSEELLLEGLSREFVNRIQNLRKDTNLDITDRIQLKVRGDSQLIQAIFKFKDSINYELLSELCEVGVEEKLDDMLCSKIIDIDGATVEVGLAKTRRSKPEAI